MKKIPLVLLTPLCNYLILGVFVLSCSLIGCFAYADECFESGTKPASEKEQREAVACLSSILRDFEEVNQQLRGKVQKLEETVFGNSDLASLKVRKNRPVPADVDQDLNQDNKETLVLNALVSGATSVKLMEFKRKGQKIIAYIEYQNIGDKDIDLSTSVDRNEVYLIDGDGEKWLPEEGSINLGVLTPKDKKLTTIVFLPQVFQMH